MDLSQETYYLIEEFLANKLTGEALESFNNRLLSDAAFKNEVELHRQLALTYGSKAEQEYLETLTNLREKIVADDEEKKERVIRPWVLILALFLLGVLAAWLLSNNEAPESKNPKLENLTLPKAVESSETKSSEFIEINKKESPSEELEEPKEEIEQLPKSKIAPNKKEETDKKQAENPPQLAMADFETNETLEGLIKPKLRSGGSLFELIEKQADRTLNNDQSIEFKVKGQLAVKAILKSEDFIVYLFNNKVSAYKNFQYLLKFNPSILKTKEGFILEANRDLALERGLYYYLIETTASKELIYINKFTVK